MQRENKRENSSLQQRIKGKTPLQALNDLKYVHKYVFVCLFEKIQKRSNNVVPGLES